MAMFTLVQKIFSASPTANDQLAGAITWKPSVAFLATLRLWSLHKSCACFCLSFHISYGAKSTPAVPAVSAIQEVRPVEQRSVLISARSFPLTVPRQLLNHHKPRRARIPQLAMASFLALSRSVFRSSLKSFGSLIASVSSAGSSR